MVQRRGLVFFLCASWLACVGDDPSVTGNQPRAGERLGPCLADGACDGTLVCHLPERLCLAPGEQPDAGVRNPDAGTGADADTDAGNTITSCTITGASSVGPLCGNGNQCNPGAACCAAAAGLSCSDLPACTSVGGRPYNCDGTASCGAGSVACCLEFVRSIADGICGVRIEASASTCGDAPCAGGKPQVCQTAADCTAPGDSKCVAREIELAPGRRVVWGICSP